MPHEYFAGRLWGTLSFLWEFSRIGQLKEFDRAKELFEAYTEQLESFMKANGVKEENSTDNSPSLKGTHQNTHVALHREPNI